jgi:hypothetical protein
MRFYYSLLCIEKFSGLLLNEIDKWMGSDSNRFDSIKEKIFFFIFIDIGYKLIFAFDFVIIDFCFILLDIRLLILLFFVGELFTFLFFFDLIVYFIFFIFFCSKKILICIWIWLWLFFLFFYCKLLGFT